MTLNFQWYIIFVRGGHEKRIILDISFALKRNNLEKYVENLKIVNNQLGKNMFPGYILCNCQMSNELLKIFYSTEGVIKFLNHRRADNNLPLAFSNVGIQRFLSSFPENKEKQVVTTLQKNNNLKVGDLVKITEGIFKGKQGKIIKEGDGKELTVKISIVFLGRPSFTSANINKENCVLLE